MGKYFGTDGFRGEAGVTLTADHAYRLGRFLGWYCRRHDLGRPTGEEIAPHKPRLLVGKDTRLSSYMLEYAIVAGLTASGADAYMLHVTTTPSVAYVTAGEDFDGGIMISASHNPYTDNGIKLVDSRGEKIDDRAIEVIEAYLDGDEPALPFSGGESIGRVVDYAAGRNRYVGYLISLAAHSYKGFRVGIDAANGASWMIARAVFEALGAKTYVIGADPDGTNINVGCGSTDTARLRRLVVTEGLDLGFAFDGDADRCIAVDERGEEVNGDHMLYILARRMQAEGSLAHNTVVTTVMSNMGLYRALDAAGIRYEQTTVGDRFVYECMTEHGYVLGGEQAGHIILSKYATTGDGILTAIMLMEQVVAAKTTLSAFAAPVVMFPQVTVNVRVGDKDAALADPAVTAAHAAYTARLGQEGRMVLRKSGTEPVLRVMVEAPDERFCRTLAEEMAEVIRNTKK